jgi:hypothetical protein
MPAIWQRRANRRPTLWAAVTSMQRKQIKKIYLLENHNKKNQI